MSVNEWGTTWALQEVWAISKAWYVELRDTNGNSVAQPHRTNITDNQAFVAMWVKNDDNLLGLRGDRKGNVITGNYIPELIENFEGATVNVQKWTQASTTFVPAQSTLVGYNANSTNLTTANAVQILQSQRLFYKFTRVPLQYKKRYRHAMVANSLSDFGFWFPSGTTTIVPNGTCFRFTSSGTAQGVITYNGTETAIGNIISNTGLNGNTVGGALNMSNSYYTNNYFVYDIIVDDDNAVFTIQDTQTGELIGSLALPVPQTVQKMWGATALPVYERVWNTSVAPSTAPISITTELQVLSTDWNLQLDASQIAGSLWLSSGRNPFTGAPLTARVNSTVPATATLSNTTASYSQLKWWFLFVAVAGAETDYCLVWFQVPAWSRFLVEWVTIDTHNQWAAVAGTPTVLEWELWVNSSAVSLATANIVRTPLGSQTFIAGAAIGQKADRISESLITPEVAESWRWIQLILRMPLGTATPSQTIRWLYNIKWRFI